MRQVLTSLAVSALALLAACGGGDDGGSAGEPALTGPAAQHAVERAMLTADDLGPGWEQIGTAPPDESEASEIDQCLSDEVAAGSNDPVAESDTHEFRRGDSPTQQHQVQVSSVVLDGDLAGRLVDELGSDEVRDCLSETFRQELAAEDPEQPVEVTLGDFESQEDFAGAGDGATRLRAPVELAAEGLTLEATVDLVVVHTGQVASALVAFALGDPIEDGELEGWTRRLAELQAG
jgi:hypothetical protein